jgi:gas vesicle protein
MKDLLDAAGLRAQQPTSHLDVVTGMSLFAAGLLVGAGLGLLFAPSAGSTLRRQIGERVSEGVTDLRERVETATQSRRPELREARTSAS